jgi:ADP-ribose pyrophosphatase YjhB (NUDIX family)
MAPVRKAFAYITHGDEIVVFEEPDFPEAGTQVPGGTLEPDEDPSEGVLREAFEETGLANLQLVRSLGTALYVAASGKQHLRHYFHLSAPERGADVWDCWEQSPSSGGAPILFRLRWVKLANVPPLCAELDQMLASLSQAQ